MTTANCLIQFQVISRQALLADGEGTSLPPARLAGPPSPPEPFGVRLGVAHQPLCAPRAEGKGMNPSGFSLARAINGKPSPTIGKPAGKFDGYGAQESGNAA